MSPGDDMFNMYSHYLCYSVVVVVKRRDLQLINGEAAYLQPFDILMCKPSEKERE